MVPLMSETPTERIAGEIRAEMARQQRSQRQLALALGYTQQAVSRRLAGHVAIDVDELDAIARFLGVSVARLMRFDALAAPSAYSEQAS